MPQNSKNRIKVKTKQRTKFIVSLWYSLVEKTLCIVPQSQKLAQSYIKRMELLLNLKISGDPLHNS